MTGSEFRLWMRRYAYSADRLADELGVSPRTVYRWRKEDDLPPYLPLALESLERKYLTY